MAHFIKALSVEEKLDILSESARYDVCLAACYSNGKGGRGRRKDPSSPLNRWIYPATIPGGGEAHMLKVLMSNICVNNCAYCFLGSKRECGRRTSFRPQELAAVFMKFYRAGEVKGLFLSSGVKGSSDETMEEMIKTASLLRYYYKFPGYIHLKILPGVSNSLVEEAVSLANRISINLEAPNVAKLNIIAPDKNFKEDLMRRMDWTGQLIKGRKGLARSQTTQFVVGPAGESDVDIMKTVDWVYRERHVFRSYFSAYQNPDEPLRQLGSGNQSLLREHRLYQCDYLLRAYGFRFRDLIFDGEDKIPLQVDPKQAWAMVNRDFFPVDINSDSEESLLRVPGIGPISARRILECRGQPLRGLDDLKKIGALTKKAAPYIEFSGKRAASEQQVLFDPDLPQLWSSQEPLQADKVGAKSYSYPGQKGKFLNHHFEGQNTGPIPCR